MIQHILIIMILLCCPIAHTAAQDPYEQQLQHHIAHPPSFCELATHIWTQDPICASCTSATDIHHQWLVAHTQDETGHPLSERPNGASILEQAMTRHNMYIEEKVDDRYSYCYCLNSFCNPATYIMAGCLSCAIAIPPVLIASAGAACYTHAIGMQLFRLRNTELKRFHLHVPGRVIYIDNIDEMYREFHTKQVPCGKKQKSD